MDQEAARQFIRGNHRAVLATVRSDGTPQLSPVVAGIDEDGYVAISTRETAVKVRNVERRPRASLCVIQDSFFGRFVQVGGPADVVRLPDAMERLVSLYRSISGEHPDWEEFRQDMRDQRRVVLRIAIESAGPDVAG